MTCLILCLYFLPQLIFSQGADTGVVPIPNALRRPERSEAPRYPQDFVIGELGQGTAPLGAYQLARELLAALATTGSTNPILRQYPSIITESVIQEIRGINIRNYRIGGGRTEPDGSVSFIVRFLGREDSITGELFIRSEVPRAPVIIPELTASTEETAATESTENTEGAGGAEDTEGEEETATTETAAPEPARQEVARWVLDDLVLEEKRPISGITDEYRFDFSPYERFF